jgi:hypothetical protein
MKTTRPTKPERPKTSVEFLRELLGTHEFSILVNKQEIAVGMIVTLVNTEVAIVDIWRNGDKNTISTHYIPLNQMGWDEVSWTGFMFGPLP